MLIASMQHSENQMHREDTKVKFNRVNPRWNVMKVKRQVNISNYSTEFESSFFLKRLLNQQFANFRKLFDANTPRIAHFDHLASVQILAELPLCA